MSRIADFLKGKSILVTGATGFLGQPLVEKILFVCPDIDCIYALIRPKQRMTGRVINAQQRLENELYTSTVFDRLRGVHGSDLDKFLRAKLIALPGDISQEQLGIAPDKLEELRSKLDIIIGSAAVVSFDAPLDEALELNVHAAGRLARFAGSCRKAVFVHVSTTYVSGADRKTSTEELFHAAPETIPHRFPLGQFQGAEHDIGHIEALINEVKIEAHSERLESRFKRELALMIKRGKRMRGTRRRRLEILRRRWIQEQLVERGMDWARKRGWNDTYTYTKALGEQVVVASRGKTPLVILRPSIIESSLAEPNPGWLDGLRMADPLIVAIGKGRLKSLPLNPDIPIDLVPVDVVVNALLASIPAIAASGGFEIYQVATGAKNPIRLGDLYHLIYHYFNKNPMLDKSGKPIQIRPLRFPNPAAFRLQHRLRSVPLSTAEKTLERLAIFESTQKVKRRLAATRAARQRLYYYGEIYQPYLNLDCRFQVDKTMALYATLHPDDQKRFNFDVTRLNWRHYIQNVHIPGVKKYILKIEGVGTMELAEEGETLPVSTIPELAEEAARRHQGKIALQIKRNQAWERLSFRQLIQRAEEAGQVLHDCRLKKGDRVLLFSENQPQWGVAFLAASKRGLVVVPIDSQTWHKDVWSTVEFTGAKAILLSKRCLDRLTPESLQKNENAEQPLKLLSVEGFCKPLNLTDLPRSTTTEPNPEPLLPVEVNPHDTCAIVFTQSPIVDPKGAVHTHENFLLNLAGVNHYLPIQPDDSLLSILPLYHTLEFTCGFLMALYGGATVTYTTSLKPRTILEAMRETGTTCMLGVPTYFGLLRDDIERRILKSTKSALKSNLMATSKQISKSLERRLGQNWGRQLFSKVHQEFGGKIRLLVSGGSQLGEELYEEFRVFGMPIYEGYGLTETAPVLTVNPLNLGRRGSAGRPLPGVELRLDYPDRDGVGEIVVRTPCLMREYYRNPAATSRVLEDGWFRTGDVGWVDVDGYLYITGRIKDVIVTGAGKNVYPVDLEAYYSQEVKDIEEICIVGVRSGLTEEVHAVVYPAPEALKDAEPEAATRRIQKDIQKLARELPSYHRLQQVHFWTDRLPRGADGNINRAEVRQWAERKYEANLAPEKKEPTPEGSSAEQIILEELSRMSGTPVSEINPETDLYSDLGLDSLMAIELLLFAEHNLNITVADSKAAQLTRVREFLAEIEAASTKAETELARPKKDQVTSALPHRERPWTDQFLMRASFAGLKALFKTYFALETQNSEPPPGGRPYILAANHSSHLDTGAVLAAVQALLGKEEARRLHVLGARDYFFKSPVKAWLVTRLLNVVPIERKETSLASLRLVKAILGRGEPVLIFPEGTRTRDGKLQPFKPGVALMALEASVPIVPTLIQGTRNLMPPGRFWPSPGRVKVTFGDPIAMDLYQRSSGGREDVYRRITHDVRQTIVAMMKGNGDRGARGANPEQRYRRVQ